MPAGHVFIHCGDWTNYGELPAVYDFVEWVRALPYEHKLIIAGNHDKWAATSPYGMVKETFAQAGATYLMNEAVGVEGLKFYGMPWVPPFGRWWFMAGKGEREIYINRIPDDIDVLITHGPPYGVLDETMLGEKAGCPILARRVLEIAPMVHCFGHIHEGTGQTNFRGEWKTTRCINAAQGLQTMEIP